MAAARGVPCAFGRGVKGVSGAAAGVSVPGTHCLMCYDDVDDCRETARTGEGGGSRDHDRVARRTEKKWAPAPVVRPAR